MLTCCNQTTSIVVWMGKFFFPLYFSNNYFILSLGAMFIDNNDSRWHQKKHKQSYNNQDESTTGNGAGKSNDGWWGLMGRDDDDKGPNNELLFGPRYNISYLIHF